jgi:hypothetical protein
MTKELKVTDIQIFDSKDPETGNVEWSANVAINDDFMLQIGTDGSFEIPGSHLAAWNDDNKQDDAAEKYDADELAETLGLSHDLDDLNEKFSLYFLGDESGRELLSKAK